MLHAPTPSDLIDRVYKVQGWEEVEGESRGKRVNDIYDITKNDRRNRYEAKLRYQFLGAVYNRYDAKNPLGIRECQYIEAPATRKTEKWLTGYAVRIPAARRLVFRDIEIAILHQWADDNDLDAVLVPKYGPGPATWQATFAKLTDATHFWLRFSDGANA